MHMSLPSFPLNQVMFAVCFPMVGDLYRDYRNKVT
jgi:hypothetical protein